MLVAPNSPFGLAEAIVAKEKPFIVLPTFQSAILEILNSVDDGLEWIVFDCLEPLVDQSVEEHDLAIFLAGKILQNLSEVDPESESVERGTVH